MEEDLKYWIWLSSIPGIGAVKFNELVRLSGGLQKLWGMSGIKDKFIVGMDKKIYEKIRSYEYKNRLNEYFERIKEYDIDVITLQNSNYPKNLKNIYDAPPVIYSRGEIINADENAIAIVGSRKATQYGLKVAERLANELSCLGITIVSGMARGIDSYAHKGAIAGGGRTIAVLGCGVDVVYPRENQQLMNNIILHGAVMSEYPPGSPPQKLNFPARNRIISGLAKGVVVVEAGESSGTLITVDFALEQGREVFAVPGNINSYQSQGTNRLIKEGAKLVTCVDDILEEINFKIDKTKCVSNGAGIVTDVIESIEKNEGKYRDIDEKEKKVLKCIVYGSEHIDNIAIGAGIDIGTTSFVLTMLEVKGLVKQLPGMIYLLDN